MATILEQYRITDFLEWYSDKKLSLNPDFQRGSVWTPAARSFLIDTILRDLPIPKIYIRTTVDIDTQKSVREVVDGQQRLRAILDFAADKVTLSKRTCEFAGKKYSTLDDEQRQQFLSYPLSVGQLLNASTDDVLEVFARLNSYSVSLNAPEKRHAKYQGDFKWSVRNSARRWQVLWEEFGILSTRERVRMLDDSLMAEMLGILLHGVTDGGQPKIDKLYREMDKNFDNRDAIEQRLDRILSYITEHIAPDLVDTPILNPPHFLMLFAAVGYALLGKLPFGQVPDVESRIEMPVLDGSELSDVSAAVDNLRYLASVIESSDEPDQLGNFWNASKSSTQRIASRRRRFPVYLEALRPESI